MSDQTLPGLVVDGSEKSPKAPDLRSSVLSTEPSRQGGRRFGKPWQAVALAVVLLAVVGGGFWWYQARQPAPAQSTNSSKNQTSDISTQVTTLEHNGQTSQAVQVLNSQIVSATSKTQKGNLYELQAEAYLDQSNYTAALKAAQSAESLAPTANSAQLVAESEAGLGDKTLAVQYYQTAANRYKNNGDMSSMQDMQAAAQGLN